MSPAPDTAVPRWRGMAIRSAICFIAALTGWAIHHRYHGASTAAFMIAFLAGGWDLTLQVWSDLRVFRFDTRFLMLLVVPGSVAVDAWGEAALLLVLFSASAAMEEFAGHRTRGEINALLRRAPKTARLLDHGRELQVSVESLRPGDVVRVTANEQIPVDVTVVTGESACDESSLTGEADPIPKRPGDTAYAGTLNLWGTLEAGVLRPASDSALQRIIRLIEEAQHLKAPAQRFTDRFGTRYTAAVILLCVGVFFVWWKGFGVPAFFRTDSAQSAFYRAMTLLTVLSPCALVLSVPSAILSAIASGARNGILFRGGAAIETLSEVRAVAMDKTGTLTEGRFHVVRVESVEGAEPDLRRLGAALGSLSNHPAARAVAADAGAEAGGAPAKPVLTESRTVAGHGVQARLGGQPVALGNREWISQLAGVKPETLPPPPVDATETWVTGPGLLGRFLLRDQLRPTAPRLVARLHATGIRTLMLTGDRAAAAERLGRESGVGEVRSQLRPEDKVAAIEELKRSGVRVAMIGDGVNDAPCLAAADVGVAMGARGSDAAIEQAEVVLMHDRLENFLLAHALSRRASRVIRQNLTLSLATMGVMAVVTLLSRSLPLSAGVAAHEGSTVVVVLNSLRLLAQRPLRRPLEETGPGPATPAA